MSVFLGTAADGLTLGAIYSLAAVAFSLFCGTGGAFSFAPGAIFLTSAAASPIVASWVSALWPVFLPGGWVVALLASILAGGAVGWLLSRAATFQDDRSGVWALISSGGGVIAALGLLQLVQQFHFVSEVPPALVLSVAAFSLEISVGELSIFALAAAAIGLVAFVIGKTDFGMLQRAARYDRTMAELLGADTGRVVSICTLIACILAALSGCMLAADQGLPTPQSGFLTVTCVLLAVAAGGAGSLRGSAGFGFLAGVGQTFWAAYFSPSYAVLAVFAVVVFLLRFLPERVPVRRPVEDI